MDVFDSPSVSYAICLGEGGVSKFAGGDVENKLDRKEDKEIESKGQRRWHFVSSIAFNETIFSRLE